jgi:N-acetylmuramoyl-L-alanine amidase
MTHPGLPLRQGDRGPVVSEVRERLARIGLIAGAVGDEFDADVDAAVRRFQQDRGITVDGIVGTVTFRRLEEARWRLGDRVLAYTPGHLTSGDDVLELQRRLIGLGFDPGRPDGMFGVLTDGAVRDFQRNVGVGSDGTCGPATFRAFERLSRTIGGGRSEDLREQLQLIIGSGSIADKVVVVDPGDGRAAEGLPEASITDDIGARLEGRLAALGTQVLMTRPPVSRFVGTLDEAARAQFANDTSADLVLSLHLDASGSAAANGVATFYYGDPLGGSHSITGRRAAELIQEEICTRTDLIDCRSHPRTWDLLRFTRMPAVRVDLGYLSNPGDRTRLSDPRFRDVVAEALAAAASRLFTRS